MLWQGTLERVLTIGPGERKAPAEARLCTGIRKHTPCGSPKSVPRHHEAHDAVGAGSADVNGRYANIIPPRVWSCAGCAKRMSSAASTARPTTYRYHGRWYTILMVIIVAAHNIIMAYV